jgi:hypothetical protein
MPRHPFLRGPILLARVCGWPSMVLSTVAAACSARKDLVSTPVLVVIIALAVGTAALCGATLDYMDRTHTAKEGEWTQRYMGHVTKYYRKAEKAQRAAQKAARR